MKLRTIVNILGLLICAFFAYLQWNDVDPEVYHKPSRFDAIAWLVFYAFVGALFAIALTGKPVSKWLLAIGFAACLVQMGRTVPGFFENFGSDDFSMGQESMTASDPRVELTREFFGAAIALVGLILLTCQQVAARKA